jgi:hypothetical protein
MNPITVLAVAGLLTVVSSPALAQAPKPGVAQPVPAPVMKAQPKAAAPAQAQSPGGGAAGKPAAPAAEMKAEKPAAPAMEMKEQVAPVATARKSRATEDARECLQRSTNTEIIKCAEKYL